MTPLTAVANDGKRRVMVIVNEGYNYQDSAWAATPFASLPNTITVNVAAWGLPVGTTRALPARRPAPLTSRSASFLRSLLKAQLL